MTAPLSERPREVETYADVSRSILAELEAIRDDHGSCLVGIGGAAAAGKTTLCQALLAESPSIQMVPQDHFRKSEADRNSLPSTEKPPGFDFELERLRREVLEPLTQGSVAEYRPRDFHTGELQDPLTVSPSGIILVEGVYVLHEDLRSRYSYRIHVAASAEARLERAGERARHSGINFGPLRNRYLEEWFPNEDRYFQAQRPDLAAERIVATDRLEPPSRPTIWGK